MDANQNNTGTTLHGILHETHIKYYGKEDIEPEDQDAKIDIEKAIKKLPERESKIVKKWMCGYSFREIGDELHITRERVRQFFNQAISMLEKKLNRKGYNYATN
jgi:RNA polymerase sigma factor (sigma-70 family)